MDLGPWEIAIIAVVILVLFGSKKMPDAARALGRSLRILKTEVKGLNDDDADKASESTGPPSAPPAELPAAPGPPAASQSSTTSAGDRSNER